jgi:DNA-directed RNA polymerase beta' subunit
MAIELFRPFVMKKLVEDGVSNNIKSAKKMVDKGLKLQKKCETNITHKHNMHVSSLLWSLFTNIHMHVSNQIRTTKVPSSLKIYVTSSSLTVCCTI